MRFIIAILLMLVVAIANVDRINMSVAASDIKNHFGYNETINGLVLASFFWGYSPFLPLAGWLLDRFGKGRVLAGAVLLWTLTSSAMYFVDSLAVLFLVRILLGIGEAPCMPSCNLVIREWSPLKERGLFTALMQAGALLGPGLAAAPAAYLITTFHNWRPSFVILSSLGFLWLILWLVLYQPPERSRFISDHERSLILSTRKKAPAPGSPVHKPMSLVSIAIHRSYIGIFLAVGPLTYALYFLLTWLPGYLKDSRRFDLMHSGWLTSSMFLLAAAGNITLGLVSDKFLTLSHEKAVRGTRRFTVAIAMLLAMIPLATVPFIQNQLLLVAAVALALGMVATAITLIYALTTDLIADEASAGRTFALVSFGGQLIGFAAPAVTGVIVDFVGFTPAFFVTAVLLAAGAVAIALLPKSQLQ